MKIISRSSKETIAEITTNHSMSLDEAINLVGEIRPEEWQGNVIIDGQYYDYDDLDMLY